MAMDSPLREAMELLNRPGAGSRTALPAPRVDGKTIVGRVFVITIVAPGFDGPLAEDAPAVSHRLDSGSRGCC